MVLLKACSSNFRLADDLLLLSHNQSAPDTREVQHPYRDWPKLFWWQEVLLLGLLMFLLWEPWCHCQFYNRSQNILLKSPLNSWCYRETPWSSSSEDCKWHTFDWMFHWWVIFIYFSVSLGGNHSYFDRSVAANLLAQSYQSPEFSTSVVALLNIISCFLSEILMNILQSLFPRLQLVTVVVVLNQQQLEKWSTCCYIKLSEAAKQNNFSPRVAYKKEN